MAAAGFWTDVGVATIAFVGTNVDNTVVTAALVAGAPMDRARRIAAGQVVGFVTLVGIAAAAAALLFEFSPAAVGLLGFVPLAMGVRGLIGLGERPGRTGEATRSRQRRRATDRAVGRSLTAAALVTLAAGGDNLAVYIPLFRQGGTSNISAIALVFVLGEVGVTAGVLAAGGHPRARAVMTSLGTVAVPLLLCGVGILVLVTAGTLSWL